MRILMVEYFLPNSIYSLELCEKLSSKNEVLMICKDNYVVEEQRDNKNLKIKSILHSKSSNPIHAFAKYINDLRMINEEIVAFKPDVLHFQGVQHAFWETLLLKINRKRVSRYFFTAHNILSHEAKCGEKQVLNKWYKNFDGIIVHNESSKEMLLSASDYNGKVYVVPHGSYDTYKTFAQKEKIPGEDKTTFLQFGIIRDYKGVDILLKAISILPDDYKNRTKFIIAGALRKDYYNFDINSVVKQYKIENCVELIIRRIEDDEVPELFTGCDCCLFPYRHIYGSGALLMAYTFKKPVIVSSIPVFKEETNNGETGLIFEKNNPDSLCHAIMDYCDLSEAKKTEFKESIGKLVEQKYNWTTSAATTVACYKET